MEKRAIVAIALTFFVILVWSLLQSKFFPSAPVKPPAQETSKPETAPGERRRPPVELKERAPEDETPSAVKSAPKREVTVETQNYVAVFTSEDARLKHFKLKHYMDTVKESPFVIKVKGFINDILGKKTEPPKEPEPLDLVDTKDDQLPLGLVYAGGRSEGSANWDVDKESLKLVGADQKDELTFSTTLSNGLKVLKRLRFRSDQYAFDTEVEIQNPTANALTTQVGLKWIGRIELAKVSEGNKDYGFKYAFMKDQNVERKDLGGAGGSGCTPGCGHQSTTVEPFQVASRGNIRWFSFGGEFFTALLGSPAAVQDMTLNISGNGNNLLKADVYGPPLTVESKQNAQLTYRVYMGPKDENRLKALGISAEKLIDFGWFTIVAKPLLWFLNFTHKASGNYGLDIIILSILIKIVFLPLTQISFKSMKEMQKVQPEMSRLKELYKNDKARLQQEMMLLYKRRKINPMSGCLPMVVQIPVFIALYNVLQNSIEMRHAPLFLWIGDLSAKDPIYVAPIIMGASMVIQQKMTPTSADPAQAKMFMLMPIMFTFLFLNFPSGLVLYWLINNVLSIAHQYYLNKRS